MTTTMNTGAASLLPCPFCGDADIQRGRAAIGERPTFHTYCNSCEAGTQGHPTREASDAAWNRRTTQQADAAIAAGGAQEPIYQFQDTSGAWRDCHHEAYLYAKSYQACAVRIVYAAPLPREAATVAEGFALVPVVMTAAMINAWAGGRAVSSDEVAARTPFQDAWKRVLAAASNGGQETQS